MFQFMVASPFLCWSISPLLAVLPRVHYPPPMLLVLSMVPRVCTCRCRWENSDYRWQCSVHGVQSLVRVQRKIRRNKQWLRVSLLTSFMLKSNHQDPGAIFGIIRLCGLSHYRCCPMADPPPPAPPLVGSSTTCPAASSRSSSRLQPALPSLAPAECPKALSSALSSSVYTHEMSLWFPRLCQVYNLQMI